MAPLIGAIEAGGTKLVCGVGRSIAELCRPANQVVVPTGNDPEQTWRFVRSFFARWPGLDGVGVGSFGPLDLAGGIIANTPKPGWQGFSWPERVAEITGGPLALDSDVDAAILAEWRHGAALGTRVAAYVTVGTGIGGGVILDGSLLRAARHPEMGHVLVPRRPGDMFPGSCAFHESCLEGLASGEAMRMRWGVPAEHLPGDHPGWALEADYLGLAVADVVLVVAPERVVLGGGLLGHPGLIDRVRERCLAHLAGYLDLGDHPAGTLAVLVVPPGLGANAGLIGAFQLASDLLGARTMSQNHEPGA